ncbi:MAG: AAA family ATPase, partial [Methanosphaera sp. rholeuAM74]
LLKEKNINSKNILYVSTDDLKKIANCSILDAVSAYLRIFFNSIIETQNEPVFLLIDEAQYDPDWSLIGKIIFDKSKKIFMIYSGSSALELSYNADSARRLLRIPITPLTYSGYLKLKYNYSNKDISSMIYELIYDNETENIKKINNQLISAYTTIEGYNIHEWEKYLKYGGFPSYIHQKETEIIKKITDTVDKIVTIDMRNIEGINKDTEELTFNLLYFFALQNTGEISTESLANSLNSNKNTIKKILDILKRTQIINTVDAFTSSSKRVRKAKKYYFATSSIKHILSSNIGVAILEDENAYYGKLLENFVASSFFNLEETMDIQHKIYYDDNKKGAKNVDFVIQRGLEKPIPVEVSYGKKDKSQINDALNRYKSSHGIIISNNTSEIVQKGDIIYIPPEIFAFM